MPIRATYYEQKHDSGNSTWKVKKGRDINGKFVYQNCRSEDEARSYANEWNAKLVGGEKGALDYFNEVTRHEVAAALAKLKLFNATVTLPQVVDYFIKFSSAPKGLVTLKQASEIFLADKEKTGKSKAYLRGCKKTYFAPFHRYFPASKLLMEVTAADAEAYLDAKKWKPTSRRYHITYLRTFFNFHIKKGYATQNPFKGIDVPDMPACNPKIISWQMAQKYLQFTLDLGRKAECASLALCFFCGVRKEEVGRLTWDSVDFDTKHVTVEWDAAKGKRRRTNPISVNALEWLKLCKDKGSIAPRDYEQRMKRLRGLLRKSDPTFKYKQNAPRHCFASWHLAKHKDHARTALMLNDPDSDTLLRYYNAMVKPKDVDPYWDIIPDSIRQQREAEGRLKDKEAEQEAKERSNCHQAVRGDDGKWQSVHKEGIEWLKESQSFNGMKVESVSAGGRIVVLSEA